MNEIILGDYKLVVDEDYDYTGSMYDIYLHDEQVGWIVLLNDNTILAIRADDTDLITMLLLKYQPSNDIVIDQQSMYITLHDEDVWKKLY